MYCCYRYFDKSNLSFSDGTSAEILNIAWYVFFRSALKLAELFITFNLNIKCKAICAWKLAAINRFVFYLIGKPKPSEKWTESATMTAISHVRRAFMCAEIKVIIFYSANKQRHDTLQHCQRWHGKGNISVEAGAVGQGDEENAQNRRMRWRTIECRNMARLRNLLGARGYDEAHRPNKWVQTEANPTN